LYTITGITVDYGATPLDCNDTTAVGIEAFVGGVSDGQAGLAAMRYTNPLARSFSWQKAWFFLEDDIEVVVLSDLSSSASMGSAKTALVILKISKSTTEEGAVIRVPGPLTSQSSIHFGMAM